MSRFIKTPILDRLSGVLRRELDSLSLEEMEKLNRECKRTTDLNCPASNRMIANLYGYHVNCTLYNRTAQYLKNGEQLMYAAFWESIVNDLKEPEIGKIISMEAARRTLQAGNVLPIGKTEKDMNIYQIVYQV